jgi:hypothetical protein
MKAGRLEKLIKRYFKVIDASNVVYWPSIESAETAFRNHIDVLESDKKKQQERAKVEAIVKDLLDRYSVKYKVPSEE